MSLVFRPAKNFVLPIGFTSWFQILVAPSSMYCLAVLSELLRATNAGIAVISGPYMFSVGALALGGIRSSTSSAVLITLVQKLSTDLFAPCFNLWILVMAVLAVRGGSVAKKCIF